VTMKFSPLLLFLIIAGCTYNHVPDPRFNTCGVDDPITELPWLSAKIDELQQFSSPYTFVEQAIYKNETVYIFNNCCPFCNTIVPVLDCSGRKLFLLSGGESDNEKLHNRFIIWKPADYACTF
jgi:hypothetical protein